MREAHIVDARPAYLCFINLAHFRNVRSERLVRRPLTLRVHDGLTFFGEKPVDKKLRRVRVRPPVDDHKAVTRPGSLKAGPLLDRLLEECRSFEAKVRSGEATLGEKKVQIIPPDPLGELGSGQEKIAAGQVEQVTVGRT